jgi:hypothetical protein|tara:strand:+ start:104 stop:400 length:297 start_codon:yes stop_codon:yes gene_type:complete
MTTIKEAAEDYKPQLMKNIADLEVVPTDVSIEEKTFKEGTADEFKVNLINLDGEDYRVPTSVLRSLKQVLEIKPELKHFKVAKAGAGMNTEYTLIPLE